MRTVKFSRYTILIYKYHHIMLLYNHLKKPLTGGKNSLDINVHVFLEGCRDENY